MSLHLDDVSVAVPDGAEQRVLLAGVDLAVQPGEVVAITGASGSGKSTLIAIAGLLRPPDSGAVCIGDVDATALKDRQRVRLRRDEIGIVYQSANLLPALTAREQVAIVAHISGRKGVDGSRRATDLLTRVGLADRLDARPAELSGGERQRVALARALMNDPRVILADEPTASLDPELGEQVMQLLVDEAHRLDAATVVVTHDPDHASRADRRLFLHHGALGAALAN